MASNHLPEWQQHTPVINKTIEIPLRSLPVVRKTWNIRKLTLSLASSFFKCVVQPQERNMTVYLTRTQLWNNILFGNLHKVYWLSFLKNRSQAAICFLDELLFAVQPLVRFWPWNQCINVNFAYGHVYRTLAWLSIRVDRSCWTLDDNIGFCRSECRREVIESGCSGETTAAELQGPYGSAGNTRMVALLECSSSCIS